MFGFLKQFHHRIFFLTLYHAAIHKAWKPFYTHVKQHIIWYTDTLILTCWDKNDRWHSLRWALYLVQLQHADIYQVNQRIKWKPCTFKKKNQYKQENQMIITMKHTYLHKYDEFIINITLWRWSSGCSGRVKRRSALHIMESNTVARTHCPDIMWAFALHSWYINILP